MKEEMRDTVSTYLYKYGKTLDQKLGLTREDLINDIREQVWKGLLTHNTRGKANLKTYLNKLIKNRFGVLFKRSKIKKNNMVNYYADVFTTDGIGEEHLITEETGETAFMRRQLIMQDQRALSAEDRIIYEGLLLGRKLDELSKTSGQPRHVVTGAIERISEMLRRNQRGEG